MKTFRQFVEHNRESSVPPLPRLPKLPGLPALPKLPKMNGNVNSGTTTQKISPTQTVAQLRQIMAQLSMLVQRLSQG